MHNAQKYDIIHAWLNTSLYKLSRLTRKAWTCAMAGILSRYIRRGAKNGAIDTLQKLWLLPSLKNLWYNSGMDKFTTKQHQEFQAWSKAHELRYYSVAEYYGAIYAYYFED